MGLVEPDQAAFQNYCISSPNNSLVPQLATITSSSKLEKRSALLHGNTLLQFHCPFALSWPSNKQLEVIQLFEVPPSVCANLSYILGGGFISFGPHKRAEVICPDPSGYEYQRSLFSWSSDMLAHHHDATSYFMLHHSWHLAVCSPTHWQMRDDLNVEDAWMEDARLYLTVIASHCLSTGSASDQQKTKHLYTVNDIVNKLQLHCRLHGFTLWLISPWWLN